MSRGRSVGKAGSHCHSPRPHRTYAFCVTATLALQSHGLLHRVSLHPRDTRFPLGVTLNISPKGVSQNTPSEVASRCHVLCWPVPSLERNTGQIFTVSATGSGQVWGCSQEMPHFLPEAGIMRSGAQELNRAAVGVSWPRDSQGWCNTGWGWAHRSQGDRACWPLTV